MQYTKPYSISRIWVSVDESRPRGHQLHRSRVHTKPKLTNLMKISRIEGYNGKYGSNQQRIRKKIYDLFEFDQIGRRIDDRNWGK